MTNQPNIKQERFSNIELYRIIVMLLIVAHHSIVNSGVMELVADDPLSLKSTFAYLFGMWGKTGINCFVMITGYFMCTSCISGRKFAKLLLEVLFYNVVTSTIFWLTGYAPFTFKGFIGMFIPLWDISTDFVWAYLIFFLTIPFLNKVVQNISQKEHLLLIVLTMGMYVIPRYVPLMKLQMNYVVWFAVIYFIGSYIRLYGESIYKGNSNRFWGILTCTAFCFALVMSILLVRLTNNAHMWSLLMSDCQGIMAIIVSICSFLWFKNLKIKQSRIINTIAASCFGVLLIHTNSGTMRQWLWQDVVNVQNLFRGGQFAIKITLIILTIYVVCTIVDFIRIQCIEKPVFKLLDTKLTNCKWW